MIGHLIVLACLAWSAAFDTVMAWGYFEKGDPVDIACGAAMSLCVATLLTIGYLYARAVREDW
jgi:hypothetical protein